MNAAQALAPAEGILNMPNKAEIGSDDEFFEPLASAHEGADAVELADEDLVEVQQVRHA